MEVLRPDAEGIARAAGLLRAGSVIAFPTDTVYGLAAIARDEAAVERIYEIKQRQSDRRLVVMVAAPASLRSLVQVDNRAQRYMRRWWPGALTLILPSLDGSGSLAVRIPDHPAALALLREVGEPLATTSANLSGQAPALEVSDLVALAGLAAVLEGGPAPGGVPSTLLDLTGPQALVRREGPISERLLRNPPQSSSRTSNSRRN